MNHSLSRLSLLVAAFAGSHAAFGAPKPVVKKAISVKSSSAQPKYPARNAYDQKPTTFWVSGGTKPGQGPTRSHPEWLQWTFAAPTTLNTIQVSARSTYGPKTSEIVASDNGKTFRAVKAKTAKNGAKTVFTFAPTKAKVFRLVVRDSDDPKFPTKPRNVQIYEVVLLAPAK